MFGGGRLKVKDGMLKEVCRLQSLLMQFIHPKVREDFINGLLGKQGSEALLCNMDSIRRLVIPAWRGRSMFSMQIELDRSSYHLNRLFEHSDEVFDLHSSKAHTWTYKDWINFLNELATSTYWRVTDQNSICIDHITVATTQSDQPSGDQKSGRAIRDPVECSSNGCPKDQQMKLSFKDSEQFHENVSKKQIRHTSSPKNSSKFRPSNLETISLSDSATDSGTSSEGSSSSSGESRRRRRRRRSQREIVKPLPFEMNGHLSFKSFLCSFERYFSARFEGSSRDCTQELKQFLPEDMQHFYDALGGRRLKYRHMKEELQVWYKSRKRGGTRYWREQLMEAEMKNGEELRLYGMRLLEIGQKAYPHSDRDCLKEVKYHFLNTIPREFANYIRQSEQMIKVVDRERKLKWADIMKLAEEEDEQRERTIRHERQEIKTSQRVWFSREETRSAQQQHSKDQAMRMKDQGQEGATVYNSRTYTSQKSSPPAPISASSRSSSCQWCGRAGHAIDACWRKKGACVLCGNMAHSRENCPRFRPRKTSTRSAASACPICQGDHLGMNCKVTGN